MHQTIRQLLVVAATLVLLRFQCGCLIESKARERPSGVPATATWVGGLDGMESDSFSRTGDCSGFPRRHLRARLDCRVEGPGGGAAPPPLAGRRLSTSSSSGSGLYGLSSSSHQPHALPLRPHAWQIEQKAGTRRGFRVEHKIPAHIAGEPTRERQTKPHPRRRGGRALRRL